MTVIELSQVLGNFGEFVVITMTICLAVADGRRPWSG